MSFDSAPFIIGVIITIIAFVVAFSRALDPEMGGGLRGLWRSVTPGAALTAVGLLLIIALVPFIGGLTSDSIDKLLFPAAIVIALAGAFLVARLFPPGWSSFVAVAVLVACIWTAGFALYLASDIGWQDMSLNDIDGEDQSPGFVIGVLMVIGTIIAPLPGLLIGIMTRRWSAHQPS